jgi:PST family polysaccharide transporter
VVEPFRFGRNVAILASGEVVSRGLNFLAFSRLARLLSLSGYGLLEFVQALMVFWAVIADLGIGKVGTREIAASGGSSLPELVRNVVSMRVLLSVIVVGLVGLVSSFLSIEPALKWLIVGFAISLLGFPFLLNWFFMGQSEMTPVAALQIVQRSIFLALTLVLVRGPDDLLRLPWAEIVAVGIAAIGYLALMSSAGEPVRISLRHSCDLQLLRQCLPVGVSQLVWACRNYLPMVLLSTQFNQPSIAFFGAALRIVMVLQTLLGTYFMTLFPAMSEVSLQPSAVLHTLLHRSLRLTVWPVVVFAGGVSLAAPLVMRLVFGVKFVMPEASTTLAVLIWLLPITALRRHYSDALIAMRHQGEELAASLAGVGLLVALTLHLRSSRSSVIGGAWAMLVAESLGMVVMWWRLTRHLSATPIEG